MQAHDIAEIVNLVNLYPLAVDSQDWTLLDRVFTEDATTDFGGGAAFAGLTAIKQVFAAIHEPFRATQHVTTNHQVAVQGDGATCLSYVHGRFFRAVPEGGDMYEAAGWYDDQLVRTPAGWRIRIRNCRTVWWGGNPAVLQTTPDTHVETALNALQSDAKAGTVLHLNALR